MKPQLKTCPKCGQEFRCYHNSGKPCWCERYLIPREQLVHLRECYSDCLCEECLPGYTENIKDFSKKAFNL